MTSPYQTLLALAALVLAPAAGAVELDGHILTVEEVGPASMIHSSVFVPLVCQDGLDNDGDGLVDAGEDPGCVDANDLSEHDPVTPIGAAVFEPLGLGGHVWTRAEDVSDDGSIVVGRGPVAGSYAEGLRWEDGVMEPLANLPETIYVQHLAVSGNGRVIAGSGADDFWTFRAFRWEDGLVSALPFPDGIGSPESTASAARALSYDGSVIVGSVRNQGTAARWDDGVLSLLGPYPSAKRHELLAVSADGTIAAGRGQPGFVYAAAKWTGFNPVPEFLSLPEGFLSSYATAMSRDGSTIVGAAAPGPSYQAFRWRDGQGVWLGEGWVEDVSGDGEILVGWGPSIWDASDQQRNLNDLLINDYGVDLGGWTLRPIEAISGDGRTLVGWGTNPDGDTEAWLVRLPPPCSDGLDNDGDGLVDFGQDPGCRSTEWSEDPECDDGVDNDGDGATDSADTRCIGRSDPNEACGLGFELVLALPPLLWLRRRQRLGQRAR